jgi:predicted RNA-binding Zn-ribbon protein involved in translation (DUF1610 family)
MTQELTFDEEFSFKLKEDHTLDDLVTAFCTFYEEENGSIGAELKKADLISGKFIVMRVSKDMLFGGSGSGLLLFYSLGSGVGRASLMTFRGNESSMWSYRPIDKIKEQVETFFKEKCHRLIEVENQTRLGPHEEIETDTEKAGTSRQPSQEWLTPLTFCRKCGAAIAIDSSTYCWNCGTKLLEQGVRRSLYYGEGTQTKSPQCDEIEYDRNCMICKLQLKDGQLLAWCPTCGAPAHRIHMLEWLHVKANCPACGQHLDTPELEGQLTQAHLRQPPLPEPRVITKKGEEAIPARRRDSQRKHYRQPSKKEEMGGRT